MKKIVLSTILLLVFGSVLEAQERKPRPTTSSDRGTWTRSRTNSNRNVTNTVPSVSRAPVNVRRGSAPAISRGGDGWGSSRRTNPIDPYAQMASRLEQATGYRYQPWDLYYCDVFYTRLMMDFGFRYGRQAFWAYAQGAPLLTPDAADLALQTSSRAADQILAATSELESLLDRYEAGSIDQKTLEHEAKSLVKEIRSQTKTVRQDFYVDYLDQRKGMDIESVDRARTVSGLRDLVADLRGKALALKRDFDNYFKDERAHVISVEDLSKPSFKARSKEIDKLTAAIKKTVVKL